MLGKNVSFGDVQEPVDESTAHLQRLYVALKELVAIEDLHDFLAVFLHKRLVAAA